MALIILVPFFLLKGLYVEVFDGSPVLFTGQRGREVKIAPFAVAKRMTNYGGWKDNYLYIFANNPYFKEEPVGDYLTFKIIGVKTDASMMNPSKDICILENINQKDQLASIDCDDIERINEATEIYREASEEVKKNGVAYIATTAYLNETSLKKILKINRFFVVEVRSDEDINQIFAPNAKSDGHWPYNYITRFKHPIVLKKDDLFNESFQAKLFLQYEYAGQWNSDRAKLYKPHVAKNIVPEDMEKWINLNITNAQDRWAIRVLISILQQIAAEADDNSLDIAEARKVLGGIENSKKCLVKYYSNPDIALTQFDQAINEYLKEPKRSKNIDEIKSEASRSYKWIVDAPKDCLDIYPPTKCEEYPKLCER